MIIEIQGSSTLLKSASDQQREEDLRRLGYEVLSFQESDVFSLADEVIEKTREKFEIQGEKMNLSH